MAERVRRSRFPSADRLTALTTHHCTYAGTESSQRLTEDTTRIDQGPEGISTTTTGSTSTGIVRDPAGTLIGMTANGASTTTPPTTRPPPPPSPAQPAPSRTHGTTAPPAVPINRVDPTGLFSVVDALGTGADVLTAGYHLLNGDTQALWSDGAGAGAAFEPCANQS